jgi:hypothetical protein
MSLVPQVIYCDHDKVATHVFRYNHDFTYNNKLSYDGIEYVFVPSLKKLESVWKGLMRRFGRKFGYQKLNKFEICAMQSLISLFGFIYLFVPLQPSTSWWEDRHVKTTRE